MNFLALWLLTLGLLVSVIYYYIQRREHYEERGEKQSLLREPESSILEYETLNRNVQNRDRLTLVTGSIILAASFLILTEGLRLELRGVLLLSTVLASLALYSFWLLFAYATTRRIDSICYRRMHEIESRLGIRVHRHIYDRIRREPWYRYGRLAFWLVFFWVLLVLGIAILSLNF
jgi:Mn2+/Fe2+ NRAMP family transporter